MFAASHHYGDDWSAPISIGAYLPHLPQVAADGDNVHLVYHAPDGNMDIVNSANAGASFSAPVAVGPGASEEVAISAGSNVYVSWSISDGRPDTMLGVSHDNGNTFRVTEISADRQTGSNEPILAIDSISGRVSLVWRENTPQQGVYLQSLDNGNTWSSPLVIDNPARQFMVADDGTYIYISYLKKVLINGIVDWRVYLAVSKDGGKTFPAVTNLSGPTGIQVLVADQARPVPWAWDGHGAFRLTGVKRDGVYIWNGRNGVVLPSSAQYLGPGTTAAPAYNSAVWQSPNKVVSYGVCK
ncbi:MAG: hypothetical protein JO208_15105 [Alphaproteobacteria bacterium]|nr:hypothetical protein [Alphaproteobacteria bacterium]